MLLRAYRLTDKLALLMLKGSAALATLAAEGTMMLFGSPGENRGILGILSRIFRLVGAVILFLLTGLWSILSIFLNIGGRVSNVAAGGVRRASGQTSAGVSGAMARRAARAEMEVGLAEDPLRAQNRVLSMLVVVTLTLLIGAVIFMTTQPRQIPMTTVANNNNPLFVDPNTPAPTNAPSILSTAIPTATQLPDVLQVRGSVAYVVRENGQTDLWAIPVGSRTPLRITNDTADERDPSWSPDGRRLAYASNRNNNWDIYIYDLAANETRRVTFGLTFEAGPSWSPDSVWLAYESYQENNLDVYILPVSDDPNLVLQRLPGSTEYPDFSPAWSPSEGTNGRFVAFVSWIDGSQDIYLFSLDTQELTNVTRTPERHEDYPAWSPDGQFIAYSALDEGREKVFVKSLANLDAPAEVLGFGREPSWSPDSTSVIAAVDSVDATHLTVYPYQATTASITPVIAVNRGSTSPVWTAQPLPVSLVNSGGLTLQAEPLYVENEDPVQTSDSAAYRLDTISVEVNNPNLNERVNESFEALRERTLAKTGIDFLGRLEDAFWLIDDRPQPGEPAQNWYKTGRAFGINRSSAIVGFPPPVEVVREDRDLNTYWRVYVRVDEEAQDGQLGEPLRRMSWDFDSRTSGDREAYDAGGRLKLLDRLPTGYYVDLTQIAADYGWMPMPAGSDWRANINTINYWAFYKTDGLSWLDAMLEIYLPSQLGGFMPTPTPAPTETAQPES